MTRGIISHNEYLGMKKLLSKDMNNTLHTRCSGSTTSRYIRLSNGSLNWGWHLSISLNKCVITICFQFVLLTEGPYDSTFSSIPTSHGIRAHEEVHRDCLSHHWYYDSNDTGCCRAGGKIIIVTSACSRYYGNRLSIKLKHQTGNDNALWPWVLVARS